MDLVQEIFDLASRALAEGDRPAARKLKDIAVEQKKETLDLIDGAAVGAWFRQLDQVDTAGEDLELEAAILAELDAGEEAAINAAINAEIAGECIPAPPAIDVRDPKQLAALMLQLTEFLATDDQKRGR